jgi:uncharacterized protein YndB with AHSA1/START domain
MIVRMDPIDAVAAVRRSVSSTTAEDGRDARAVVAERTYPAPAPDVWDALTSIERLPRWFAPVSGDLRLGGRYAIEGNASGTITACEPPHHLALTWEFDGDVSWVDVTLTATGEATTLRLTHVAPVGDHWERYGAGAVGIGWDLGLLGLAEHLRTGANVAAQEPDPAIVEFMRGCGESWGDAEIAGGADADGARARAAATVAFYTGG